MRTVYLGTSEFAVTILEALAASEHRPQLVVTRPDRPKGRGKKLQAPPVADAARALGIPVIQPERLADDDATAEVLGAKPEALVVCAYGAIVKEPLLTAVPTYNVHPSLLPRWRGAAPIERAIEAGDEATGVSIMALVEELDAGPVAAVEEVPIEPTDTYGTLAPRLADVGARLLVETLGAGAGFTPQPEEGVTYAEKITADDRTLDPERPAAELDRTVRALSPHIGARLELQDGTMLGVRATGLIDDPDVEDDAELHVEPAGVRVGTLELRRVQPPGGREMDAADWARGRGAGR